MKTSILGSCASLALMSAATATPAVAKPAPPPVPVPPASAEAPSTEDSGGLQDIVITANKRAQNLQDVGISVTAFSGDKLQQLGFTSAVDIVRQTPGLNIVSSGRSNTNVNVRGVSQNDFADHLEGPIAVYADEGYLGNAGAVNGQTFDLERVEVLRGPQGTLFGRNATGGLIHYISRAPTDHLDAYAQVTGGERGLFQFEGAMGGPLSDGIRARLAVAGIREDGFVKNRIGPDPENKNNISARLTVDFDLSPTTELRVMVNGNTDDGERGVAGQSVPLVADANGQGRALGANEVGSWPNIVTGGTVRGTCPVCDIYGYKPPSDPYVRDISSPGSFRKDILHSQAKLTTQLGDSVNLTSITDFLYVRKETLDTDTDGGPTQGFNFSTKQKYHQLSQELRLDGHIGALKWVAGTYYLHTRSTYASYVDFDVSVYVGAPVCNITPNFPCPTPVPGVVGRSRNDYHLDVDSFSGFAQLEYELSPRLSVIGGVRYTHDQKRVDYQWNTTAIPNFPTTYYNPSTDPSADRGFGMVSAKAEIDWHPIDHTLVYASYSRGTKGGNWALPVFPPPITAANFAAFPHKSEVLTDYELGLKTDFWDRKARFNIGGFYYLYDNYQAFSLAGAAQSIVNKDAKAWGGEAELELTPTKGFELSIGASTMWSRVYNLQYPTGAFFTGQLPFSSKWSFTGLARYEWDAFNGKLFVQSSFSSVGPHYLDVANEPFVHEGRYITADARVGYTTGNDRWNGALWVKNLNNARYRTFALDLAALSYGNQNFAAPRQFGATLGYKF